MRQTQVRISAAPKTATSPPATLVKAKKTRRGVRRGAMAAVSWMVALLLSLGLMLYCVARIAGGTPVVHRAIPHAFGGAISLTLGQPPAVQATAAFVYDPNLGFVYYSKNADQEMPMASCTKIMTALLAVERGNLDQMVTVGADAHALVNPDSSYMGLDVGEKLTLRDLLYGLVMPSGNDAAVAIADAIGGNVPNFVAMMNARAQQLGLTRTHFVTPHGLDAPGHYTTARDLAVLSAYALRNPTIVKVVSTLDYIIPKTATHKAYHLHTGNDLLAGARAPYPGALGVKPGFTGNAGFCMSFAANRHGHLIVGAVLDDPSWQVRIVDMHLLLDWGFEQEGVPPALPAAPWSYPSPNE